MLNVTPLLFLPQLSFIMFTYKFVVGVRVASLLICHLFSLLKVLCTCNFTHSLHLVCCIACCKYTCGTATVSSFFISTFAHCIVDCHCVAAGTRFSLRSMRSSFQYWRSMFVPTVHSVLTLVRLLLKVCCSDAEGTEYLWPLSLEVVNLLWALCW